MMCDYLRDKAMLKLTSTILSLYALILLVIQCYLKPQVIHPSKTERISGFPNCYLITYITHTHLDDPQKE